jgi:hypothetical protein
MNSITFAYDPYGSHLADFLNSLASLMVTLRTMLPSFLDAEGEEAEAPSFIVTPQASLATVT